MGFDMKEIKMLGKGELSEKIVTRLESMGYKIRGVESYAILTVFKNYTGKIPYTIQRIWDRSIPKVVYVEFEEGEHRRWSLTTKQGAVIKQIDHMIPSRIKDTEVEVMEVARRILEILLWT